VRNWAALCCLSVLLAFAWLETTHAHPAGELARGSTPCAVCIAVHANAPALTAHPAPVLFTVETLTASFRAERKDITAEISLFIRPPPAV
jgi:hypothetical protein